MVHTAFLLENTVLDNASYENFQHKFDLVDILYFPVYPSAKVLLISREK